MINVSCTHEKHPETEIWKVQNLNAQYSEEDLAEKIQKKRNRKPKLGQRLFSRVHVWSTDGILFDLILAHHLCDVTHEFEFHVDFSFIQNYSRFDHKFI